ncbi:MAG TPA: O-antigen ligase family protein [Fibrobacteraceae bacterium]|nr:O-antigen ligase family protein [Fibrobacteraceae bacterium]
MPGTLELVEQPKDFGRSLFKFLILILLALLSCDYLRIPLGSFHLLYSRIYLSSFFVPVFGLFFLFLRPTVVPRKSVVLLLSLLHLWILIRIFTVDYISLKYPLCTFLNSVSGLFALLWVAPLVVHYQLERFTLISFTGFASGISILGALHSGVAGIPEMGEVSILGENHMHIGLYMILNIGCISYLFSCYRRFRHRLLLVGALSLALLSIILSGSRAGTMAGLLVIGAWVLLNNSAKVKVIALFMIPVVFAAFQWQMKHRAAETDTFAFYGFQVDYSLGYRFFMWYGLVQLIFSNLSVFWFGVGYESLITQFNKLVYFPVYSNAAHNIFVHVWAELGLIGFVLFFGSLAALLLNLRQSKTAIRRAFIPTLLAILLTGLMQETLYGSYASSNFNTLFWMIMGIVITRNLEPPSRLELPTC